MVEARFAEFRLNISKEKSSVIKFGRNAWKSNQNGGDRVSTFDFLGFTHYCSKSRRGKFIMGHKTAKDKLSRAIKEINEWLRKIRNLCVLKDWWKILRAKLVGHYNYFGISGNMRSLSQFYINVSKLVYKWVNRRSQKKSMTFKQYIQYLDWNPLPQPRVYHNMYTLSPSR